jgi:hypothetical protein
MQSARTMTPRDREPIQTLMAEADGGTPTPPPPLGWCQRLAQRWARPCVGRGQPRPLRRADHWDAPHAHVPSRTTDHPLDLLAKTGGYDLRMALYHLMLS